MLFLFHHKARIKRDFNDRDGYIVSYQPGMKDVFSFGIPPKTDFKVFTLGPLFHNKNSIALTKLTAYDVKLKSFIIDPLIPPGSVVINSNEQQQTIVNGEIHPDFGHHMLLPHSFRSLYHSEPRMYIFLDPNRNLKISITLYDDLYYCRLIFYQKNEIRLVFWHDSAFLCIVDLLNRKIQLFETIKLPTFLCSSALEHFTSVESLEKYYLIFLGSSQGPLYCSETRFTKKIIKGSIEVNNLINDEIIVSASI
jgi:hypothetical protein